MAFDTHKNLAVSSVATPPAPATSGTSLTVTAGQGPRFVAPANATVWPANAMPTPANAEIVRVTAVAGDVLTIVRSQEGSAARAMGIGDVIAATVTAKTLTDLETQAALLAAPNLFTATQSITVPGAQLAVVNPTAAADQKYWLLMAYNDGSLYVQPASDVGIALVNALRLDRTGDAKILRDLYEKGRTTPLGHWTVADCASYTQTPGFTGNYSWTLIGKTLIVVFSASGVVAGAAAYSFNLPAGLIVATAGATGSVVYPAGAPTVWVYGSIQFVAGNAHFTAYREGTEAWAAGQTYIQATVIIPVQ